MRFWMGVSRVRLDNQTAVGERSPRSYPELSSWGGTWTGLVKAAEIKPRWQCLVEFNVSSAETTIATKAACNNHCSTSMKVNIH